MNTKEVNYYIEIHKWLLIGKQRMWVEIAQESNALIPHLTYGLTDYQAYC